MIQVNRDRMDALLKAFHTLTGMRIVLFDDELREIMACPQDPCEFCRQMRSLPEFYRKCVASDRAAFRKSRHAGEPILYTCHAGLTEAVIQLRDGDAVAGYIMFGQVIPQETSQQTRLRLAQICIDNGNANLPESITTMLDKSNDQIRAAATILESLSVYLWMNRFVTLPRKEFIDSLDSFLDQRIAGPVTAEDVCAYFGIGKTSLYKAAAKHLDCGIAEYVKKTRIARACRMLGETGRPITAIASAVGFGDYNYFSKCFKQQMGMTAIEYRKRHR